MKNNFLILRSVASDIQVPDTFVYYNYVST